MARTDGRHDTISASDAMALAYRCRSCGQDFDGTALRVFDLQTGGGSPSRLLSEDGRDFVREDDLRCGAGGTGCESQDIFVREVEA